ncbi:MAG: peptide chain release factor N(5)-glutamine methyltransferase [Gemmatimonadota bacterium]
MTRAAKSGKVQALRFAQGDKTSGTAEEQVQTPRLAALARGVIGSAVTPSAVEGSAPHAPHAREREAITVGALVTRLAQIIGSTEQARDLLSLLHSQPRHWITLSRESVLSEKDVASALNAAERLAAGAPIQYAAGRAAFRHLVLAVDERVLIPRPETELLVDLVLDAVRDRPGGIAVDVGTGSGAIAVALATEGRFERVIGTDISRDALAVARTNVFQGAGANVAPVELRHGALLEPVLERGLSAIVSNPPYISHAEAGGLPSSVRDWEPAVALFSEDNGLATTLQLVRAAAVALAPNGVLALEGDMRRMTAVADAAASSGFADVRVLKDLTGRDRFVVARRREE